MIEIIPAVLAKDFNELNEKLARFVNTIKIVQIDICDGRFVSNITWPIGSKNQYELEKILNEENGLPFWNDLDFEFDLMVLNAHKQFDFFMKLGAKRIIFHLEAETEDSFKEFLESMDPYYKDNIEIGIAINTTTDIEKLEPFINYMDFVQCMGIEHIGFQGQDFDERVFDQVRELRSKYSELKISIDGGVNENTIQALLDAGADRFVIGSALLQSDDIREKIKEFENL